jgi:hypothetical protein
MDRQSPSLEKNAGTEGPMGGYATRSLENFRKACDETYRERLTLYNRALDDGAGVSHEAIENLIETENAKKGFIRRVTIKHKLTAAEVKNIVIRSCIHVYSYVNAFVFFIRFFIYSFMYTTRHIFCFKIAR